MSEHITWNMGNKTLLYFRDEISRVCVYCLWDGRKLTPIRENVGDSAIIVMGAPACLRMRIKKNVILSRLGNPSYIQCNHYMD